MFKGEGPRGWEKRPILYILPDFVRDADTEVLGIEIIESDTGSVASLAGRKGTEGHLLMRVIKHALITSKAWLVIAVSQIKKESYPRKRDQTVH